MPKQLSKKMPSRWVYGLLCKNHHHVWDAIAMKVGRQRFEFVSSDIPFSLLLLACWMIPAIHHQLRHAGTFPINY